MKRDVQLYIAGRRVDLGDDSWILFNWVREDLSNPTAVLNSSSHQISIPGTCRNNAVFGEAFRLDRRTLFGIRYDGTYFDPTRKTPFTLYAADGTVLESGYCRLDAIDTHDRRHAYTVSLFGGLGSFFYALATKDDGSERTLADLIWTGDDGNDVPSFNISVSDLAGGGAAAVADAWGFLRNGVSALGFYHFWNVVNFAPCYNGLPADFDASHAVGNHSGYFNIPESRVVDDVTYGPKAGLDAVLVTFSNKHTEWELGDLRWYLQRPVVNVRAFIAAVCDTRNNGGYTVSLDPTFFRNDNPAYANAWWTLPLISTENRASGNALNDVLKSTKTPMRYLCDYAKHFGLVFLWDGSRKTVSIVTRATFYGEHAGVLDFAPRVDRSQQVSQDPVLADKRWYQLGNGGKGEFVEQYKDGYGKPYAAQRIDTGYEFDAGTNVLTDGNVFAEAAEVCESDMLFCASEIRFATIGGWSWRRYLQVPRWEQVSVELWNEDGDTSTFDIQCPVDIMYYDNPDYPGADWLPKLQLHGTEEKALDGADVLVFFNGLVDTPAYTSGDSTVHKTYHLTNDSAAMTELAGGPCWDLTRTGIAQTALPSFRRTISDQGIITDSWEWGVPAVRAVPAEVYGTGQAATLYDLWWKDYLADRYNADTRVLKCMADLRGLPVGQALLRRFVWLDGAVWTINAIRNHSLTSWDLTEVELVKVQDKGAYLSGPGSEGDHYLRVSPASNSYTIPGKGGTLTLTLRSSSDWDLVVEDSPAWITWNRVSGEGGTAVVEATLTANPSTTTRRTANVTITNEDGDTLTFSISQEAKVAASISVNPASLTFSAAGTSGSGTATRGKTVNVTATGDWSVDTTTVPAWLTVTPGISTLSLKVTENTTGNVRTAQVKVKLDEDSSVYAIVNVTQEVGSEGSISIIDTHGNEGRTSGAAGGTFTLNITATGAWTLTKTAAWVTLSATTGTGNGSVTVTVAQNTGSSDRSDAIVATLDGTTKTDSYYLQQEGSGAPTDSIQLLRYDNPWYDYDDQQASAPAGSMLAGHISVLASGAWTLSTSDSWIQAYGSWSGSGNGSVWYTCSDNPGAPRTGTIVGTCGTATATFYVRQAGTGGGVSAYFSQSSVNAAQQTITLVINAPSGTGWAVTNISSGLTLQRTTGSGPDEIDVTVAANTGAQRTLSVTVNGTVVSLTQAAASSSTYFRVSPFGTVNVAADATSKTFTIESNAAWQVTSSHPDVTISPASGSNNGTVTVTFPANSTQTANTYPLLFQTTSGDSITVNASIVQAASSGPTPSGDISVYPGTVELAGAGESKNVTVTTAYSWTAVSSASWIVVSPDSGSGVTTVAISAARNTGAPRTGTVTFVGHGSATLTVAQGSDSELAVTSNAVSLPAEGGSDAVTVYASGAWGLSSGSTVPSWLSVSMPSHAGSVNGEALTFTANSANTSSASRSATLRFVLADDPTVYQDITVTQLGSATLYVSPNNARIGARDYDGYMNVVSNTDWEITSIGEGITIDPDFYTGTGNAVIPYYVGGNPSLTARTMSVAFHSTDGYNKTATFTVYQDAGTLVTSPYSYTFAGSGEQLPFKVLSSALWEVYSKPAWITVTPASGGANTPDGLDVVMEATANSDTANGRSGVVVFRHTENTSNTWAMNVSQTAGPTTTLTINPTSLSLSDESQYTGTLEVRSSGSWTVTTEKRDPLHPQDATEPADDIITFSAYSGTGNADLTFTLARNSGDEARTVWVRVRNGSGTIVRTLEIWQPADDGVLTVAPDVSELVFSSDTPSTVLSIRSTLSWSMTGPAWLTMSPSSGTAGATVSVTLTATVDATRVQLGRIRITLSDGTTRDIAVRTVPDFTPIS